MTSILLKRLTQVALLISAFAFGAVYSTINAHAASDNITEADMLKKPYNYKVNKNNTITITSINVPKQPDGTYDNSGLRQEKLVIPETIGGKKVVEIGNDAFTKNRKDHKVTFYRNIYLPKTIQRIGDYAFPYGTVIIPNTNDITYFGKYAFKGVTIKTKNGKSLAFDHVTRIGERAFYRTAFDETSKFTFHFSSKHSIGKETFYGATLRRPVDFTSPIQTLSDGFMKNTNITQPLTFKKPIKAIRNNAFANASIRNVFTFNNVGQIDGGAFKYTEIKRATRFNQVGTIKKHAFYKTTLTNLLRFNGSVNRIETDSFYQMPVEFAMIQMNKLKYNAPNAMSFNNVKSIYENVSIDFTNSTLSKNIIRKGAKVGGGVYIRNTTVKKNAFENNHINGMFLIDSGAKIQNYAVNNTRMTSLAITKDSKSIAIAKNGLYKIKYEEKYYTNR